MSQFFVKEVCIPKYMCMYLDIMFIIIAYHRIHISLFNCKFISYLFPVFSLKYVNNTYVHSLFLPRTSHVFIFILRALYYFFVMQLCCMLLFTDLEYRMLTNMSNFYKIRYEPFVNFEMSLLSYQVINWISIL